jgi:hypothetical protein
MLQVKLENPALFTGIAMIMWCVRSVRATHHAANNILACAAGGEERASAQQPPRFGRAPTISFSLPRATRHAANNILASVARQQSHSLFRSLRSRADDLFRSRATHHQTDSRT